jgi:hypothetical protein
MNDGYIHIEDIFHILFVWSSISVLSFICLPNEITRIVKVLRYPARHFALGEYTGGSPLVELPRLTWEYSKALPLPRNSPQVNAGYMDRCRTMCSAVSAILIGTGEMNLGSISGYVPRLSHLLRSIRSLESKPEIRQEYPSNVYGECLFMTTTPCI